MSNSVYRHPALNDDNPGEVTSVRSATATGNDVITTRNDKMESIVERCEINESNVIELHARYDSGYHDKIFLKKTRPTLAGSITLFVVKLYFVKPPRRRTDVL